ncbi:MAG: hypothetical protein E6J83_00465 [Deltaproteobacteria bacterium]|nr:MAG: hypothetical protein E6J83_00465 [Deltaproteobacteria bacterium]
MPARGRAAGKVILLGEHAVVYGRPALAAGLPLGLVAEAVAGDGPVRLESDGYADDPRSTRLVVEAAAAVGLEPRDLVVRVCSELPAGVGVGSSAALAVAVLRALAAAVGRRLARDDEIALATRLEAAERARHEALFDAVAATVEDGARAAEAGDLAALGHAFDRNQALLEALGVSAPEVEALVARARASGALGAKLTGGGTGGAVIALARTPERLAAALGADGTQTIVAHVGAATEAAVSASEGYQS